jgi:Ca2+-dependent lipid-binding protein
VVVRFASQRVKTPVIKKTLNPVYDEKEATFNFPLYPSVVEKIGATIELVLWDKDLIGKDYLGEVSIPLSQWFDLSGARSYEDKKNAVRLIYRPP